MTGKKSAVIIGAGIGGIATASYLAKNGYNVNVYEKNPVPGGRCGQLIRDGHRFDLGATMLMMPGIYREVFQSLGIPLFENNDIKQLEDLYKIYFDNNEVIAFSPDKNKMKIQLEKIEPGSFEKSQKYVSDGYEIFQLGINKLIDSMKYSCSAICYHWGLDKVYPQLGHHSVFLSDGFRDDLDRIFKDKSVSDHPSFYVHAPARTDPSAAPHNQDTLSVIVGGSTHPGNGIPNVLLSAKLTTERILNK